MIKTAEHNTRSGKELVPEKRYKIEVYQVIWPCEVCDSGEMERVIKKGAQHAIMKYTVDHKCNKCEHTDNTRGKSYPYIEHKRIDKENE